MKKFLLSIAALGLVAMVFMPTYATENWDLTGSYTIDSTCTAGCAGTYSHHMDVTSMDLESGEFSGTGYYIVNPSYTWDMDGTLSGDTVNFNILYTGLNSGYYVDFTGQVDGNGTMSGTAVSSTGQTFDWSTSDKATFNRRAYITSPDEGENVWGEVTFSAYLVDDDADPIQWAVRKGTCAAGTNTVFGNVDGKTDVASIDTSNLSNQTFSFTDDMTGMELGMYCFIYNPVEDAGEVNIRLTRQFQLVEPPVEDVPGCMDSTAHNYDSEANVDDGSCLYTPTNKDQCKNGGWMLFNDPTFRNQGDCVSWLQASPNAVGNRKDN